MLHTLVLGVLLFTGSVDIDSPSSEEWAETSPADSSGSLLEDSVFTEGVEAFYRTDWVTAESIFNKLKQERPEDPMPWFFSSMMPFWEYFFIEQTPEKAAEFLDDSMMVRCRLPGC